MIIKIAFSLIIDYNVNVYKIYDMLCKMDENSRCRPKETGDLIMPIEILRELMIQEKKERKWENIKNKRGEIRWKKKILKRR